MTDATESQVQHRVAFGSAIYAFSRMCRSAGKPEYRGCRRLTLAKRVSGNSEPGDAVEGTTSAQRTCHHTRVRWHWYPKVTGQRTFACGTIY